MNKSEMVYRQNQAVAGFMGFECFGIDEKESIQGYDKNIAEIHDMIAHFIEKENKEEVSYWRQMLQEARVAKRHAKKMIAEKNRTEAAYT